MIYSKTVTLKDGRTCVIRNGEAQDAEGVLANFIATHGQTEFLSTYPDETTFTVEYEEAYLKKKKEAERDAALVAEVDGVITGTAGIDLISRSDKVKHRAHFGISVDKDWWGIGIGRALTEACIECAKAAGYLQMELGVIADNERAISLYRSVGFTEYGRNPKGFRTRDGRWQKDILMRLELD